MRVRASASLFAVFGLVGCATPAPPEASPIATERRSASTIAPSSTSAASAPSTAAATPPPEPPTVTVLPVNRVSEGAVHSIAFGKPPKVAAIGVDVWLDAGNGLVKIAKPPVDAAHVRIFFGRDDQPRLMGAVKTDTGRESVYFRWRGGAWKRAGDELGGLGTGPKAPLFGVLGHADPEVVCKVSAGCTVKRLSGWTSIEGLPGEPFVELCGATPWAYEGQRVWSLAAKGWASNQAKPTFEKADGLWAVQERDVWVAERGPSKIHHFDGEKWSQQPSPIRGPRSVWASSASDVWIVGDGGAAHYNGGQWRRVKGAPERLEIVVGRSAGDVWMGGSPGLYRAAE